MPRIVCLGIVTLDRIWQLDEIPATPVKIAATGFRETGGGMAATAAVAIAALGGRPALWSRIGDDATGARLSDELARRGVDIDAIRTMPGAVTPCSAALVDAAGERLLAVFRGSGLADDPAWLPFGSLDTAAAVMADLRWGRGVLALLEAARARGIPSVLDADVGEPETLAAAARLAGHVVFSSAGLAQFAGVDGETGLRRAAARVPGLVGVTIGAGGYLWLEDGALRHVAGFTVDVRDTTGAGDVFHGAYTLAIAERRPPGDAARFATAAAALKCANGNGWAGMPSRAAVDALMAGRAL